MNLKDPMEWARIGQCFMLTSHDRRMGAGCILKSIDPATAEALRQIKSTYIWAEGTIMIAEQPFGGTGALLRGMRQKDLQVIYDALAPLWPDRRSRLGELKQKVLAVIGGVAHAGDVWGVMAEAIDFRSDPNRLSPGLAYLRGEKTPSSTVG